MASHNHLFSLLSLSIILLLTEQICQWQWGLQVEAHDLHKDRLPFLSKKLFVFGDSYADTGNIQRGLSKVWKQPYGTTFPGKPAGRFSDGRVLTDYIAKYLKVKSPVPHGMMKEMPHHIKYGMNFAFGGTGVFDTFVAGPNMTTQIHLFQTLVNRQLYTKSDLAYSVALVSVAGNDYSNFLLTNGSIQDVPSFIELVVNQTAINMRRIHEIGVKKIAVTSLPPLGCLPEVTLSSSFHACNDTYNMLVRVHNSILSDAVAKLNEESKGNFSFLMLNLYEAFMSVLNGSASEDQRGHKMQNTLKPCCDGVSSEYSCGSVDENHVKKYSVCDDPKAFFFWDSVHPTQAGWHAVYNNLRATSDLQQLDYQDRQ